jgi:DNA-binding MarR family transcriptional regulator
MTSSDSTPTAARLRRIVALLARRLRPALQDQGISAAKLSVLGQLYHGGPMIPTELAQHEGVKVPSLTRLLAELELDGWLTREAHESDGRRSVLNLTISGRDRMIAAATAAAAPLAEFIATTSSAEQVLLQQACDLLERMGDALAAPGVIPALHRSSDVIASQPRNRRK